MAKRSKIDALREKGDIPGLERIMQHTTDWLDGMEAAEALAMLGHESGLDYLLECLHDQDGDIRSVAIEMLQNLEYPRARQALIEMPLSSIYSIVEEIPNTILECGNCGNTIPFNARVCPRCGIQLSGEKIRITETEAPITGEPSEKEVPMTAEPSQATVSVNSASQGLVEALPDEVVVVDFDIPFTSLVILLVKVALASIPAFMILGVIIGIIFLLFGGALAGLISQMN